MPPDMEPRGFEALVLWRLDKLEERFDRLDDSLTSVRLDVVGLKIRSGIWGAVAGTIPALLIVVLPFVLTGSAG